jgi:multidrug efflux pump subunit AcrA (membrane-fusion protein)
MIASPPRQMVAVRSEHLRLRHIVEQVAALCQQRLTDDQFYPRYLRYMIQALHAPGGAIWLPAANGDWQRRWKHSATTSPPGAAADARRQHLPLVRQAAASERGMSFTHRDRADIPPEQAVVVVAMRHKEQAIAVVELLLPADQSRVGHQREILFLQEMAVLARGRPPALGGAPRAAAQAPRRPDPLAEPPLRFGGFVRSVHQSLDLDATGFTVVNELRSMLGCDRVSLAVGHGHACRLVAISGQDTIDRRADTVRQLEALACLAPGFDQAVWCDREEADWSGRLAPGGRLAHAAGVDSPWARLGVLPLRDAPAGHPCGAVIVELFDARVSRDDLARRTEIVLPHVAQAIANARHHARIPLLPLWHALHEWKSATATRWRKPLLWLAALLLIGLFLGLFPVPLRVHGRGVLQPARQRDVFADVDGVVTQVHVAHGDHVQPGDMLLTLHNSDLEVQIADVLGRRRAIDEQLSAMRRRRHEERLAREAADRLAGQMLQLREQLHGLDQQHVLLSQKQQRLVIRSPIAGRVSTWNVSRRLLLRPVAAGQILMTIADEDGPWQLEVFFPESDIGHLESALAQTDAPLGVQFVAVTAPATEHSGILRHVDAQAQLHDDHGHALRGLVDIDRGDVPDAPSGATVQARVDCGRRAVGYVWLRRLLGFLYTRIVFRLG